MKQFPQRLSCFVQALFGKSTGKFAQCEMEVIEVHQQLAAAMCAAEGGSGPSPHQHDAPLHRMLDRANDYLAGLLATRSGSRRFQHGQLASHDSQEASPRRSGNGGHREAAEDTANEEAEQACCTSIS